MFPEPRCLHCEKKKTTKYPITLDKRIGFICEECYNTHLWAYDGDNRKQVYLLENLLHTKLFNMKKDIT